MKIEHGKITAEKLGTILSSSIDMGATRFALWFYPVSTMNQRKRLLMRMAHFNLGRHRVEPITLYGPDEPYSPVEETPTIFALSHHSIATIVSLFKNIERFCDSVAVYPELKNEFILAVVFHESDVMIRATPPNQAL